MLPIRSRYVLGALAGAAASATACVTLAAGSPTPPPERVAIANTRPARFPVCCPEIVLTGVVVGNPQYALIRVRDGDEQPFAVGQDVAPGVILRAVLRDSAVVSHNGALQRLPLLSRRQAIGARQGENDQPVSPTTSLPDSSNLMDSSTDSTESAAPQISNFLINRDMLSQNGGLLTHVKFDLDPGHGYRIVKLEKQNTPYGNLGLQTGDTVESIDGKPVRSFNDLLGIYQLKQQDNAMQMDVLRNGKVYRMNYEFQ